MNDISIVTDSTSDLPEELYKNLDLKVVPLSVLYKQKIYIDNGRDIIPGDFYNMIKTSDEMPKAAQPTPGDFIKLYSELRKQHKNIVSVHISSKLSGTINSAELAAKQFDKGFVKVVDSEVVHMPCGFIALKAAAMAKSGFTWEDILAEIPVFREKIKAFFLPHSMENLIKGGRVSKIKGQLANLLEIKPILTLKNGEVALLKNSRKWDTAKNELLNIMENNINKSEKLTVSIGDVASAEEADFLQEKITERFKPERIIRTGIGIVVGSHLGIGGIGVTFFEDNDFN